MTEIENTSLFSKVIQVGETFLDGYLAKAKSNIQKEAAWDRRSVMELDYGTEQQYGWKEKRGLIGPDMLKNMARKDSVIVAIRKTRLAQVSLFAKPQKDKYSPGWVIQPCVPADIPEEDKIKLADPTLDDEARDALKFKLDKKRTKEQMKQKEDMKKISEFLKHCGNNAEEPSHYKRGRWDFLKWMLIAVDDRLIYNYSATEFIPTKDGDSIAKFYPVSAGTIRYVSKKSAERYKAMLKEMLQKDEHYEGNYDDDLEDFEYVQVVRGRVRAAWTAKQLAYEPATPTVDPEDMGYAPGELEQLIQIVTAHLYAEAHNRNFFTQGIGTKGILHIKGDNINRAQLEAFKRQWFNQVVNTRNAFRPPIIGIADDVKWVELAQSNKDMEFDNWMHYLIRICCAVYQIDPAEINFDISKVNTSTLNESSNEARIKNSRDKGLKPLLDYIENLVNNEILRRWNPDLADQYEFKFVGLEAETRKEEIDRLKEETQVWKTVNEARIEMGRAPIEDGDIILAAAYTQYKMQKDQAEAMEAQQEGMEGAPVEDTGAEDEFNADVDAENNRYLDDLQSELDNVDKEIENEAKQKEKEQAQSKKSEETKKSMAVIEYYMGEDDDN